MLIDKSINLDLPVDAYDADGNPRNKEAESVSDESSTEASQAEEKVEEKKEEVKDEEEQRVPYSRFSKIREQKEQAERDAEEARELLREALAKNQEPSRESDDASSYDVGIARDIKRLYGDTPEAREIIEIQTRHMRAVEDRAERKAIEAVERVRNYETQVLARNENVIEQRLDDLSDKLGRELSEKESDAILNIVDEFTPTGSDGKYVGEILPFDKAWEIHELRQEKQSSSTKKNRSAALAASSSRSHGEPSESQSNNDFNPRNWNSLYKRIGKL